MIEKKQQFYYQFLQGISLLMSYFSIIIADYKDLEKPVKR